MPLFHDSLYGRAMHRRTRLSGFVFALLVFASSGIGVIAGDVATSSAASVPICHASNKVTAKVTGENGASSTFYFLITFTNNGATRCSLPGIQTAAAVTGEGEAEWNFVGPPATYRATEGVRRGAVVIRSRGGKAYVEYYVANSAVWTKSQCAPQPAAAVLLGIPGLGHIYIPFKRLGANEVCTKLASTAIGPLSSRTY
jgi:hypothetical protein